MGEGNSLPGICTQHGDPMRVLITGVGGLLGAHLASAFGNTHEVMGIDRNPSWGKLPIRSSCGDLTDSKFLDRVMGDFAPELLIHCAAITDVDACEKNDRMAYAVNADATETLAKRLNPHARFVYISTDAVLHGDTPWATEESIPVPRTVYGLSKRKGEQAVEQCVKNHLIVRSNFYGWSSGRKKTFAEWLYRSLEQGLPIRLYADVFFAPIYVMNLVEGVQRLVDGHHQGLFHLGGKDLLSKYDFGVQLAKLAGFSMAHAKRSRLEEGGHPAPRAKELSMDSSRFEQAVGYKIPSLHLGLKRFLGDRSRTLQERCAQPMGVSG